MGDVTNIEEKRSEVERRRLQRDKIKEGFRSAGRADLPGAAPVPGGAMDRSGSPTGKEQLQMLMETAQRQNAALIQEIGNQKRILATMVARLESMIRVLLVTGVAPDGKMRPEDFTDGMQAIMAYDSEFDQLLRIKDMRLRATRIAIWNTGRNDEDRVPLKPMDLRLVEWLLDPQSPMTRDERLEVFDTLDYIDDRSALAEMIGKIPVPPTDLAPPSSSSVLEDSLPMS